jgi:hypothetical protein
MTPELLAAMLLTINNLTTTAAGIYARTQAGEITPEQAAAEWARATSSVAAADAAWEAAGRG